MIQSISQCSIGMCTQNSTLANQSTSSTDFEDLIGQSNQSEATQTNSKAEKTKSLMDSLQEMTSEITICIKCGSIYRGPNLTVCAKCGYDLSSQKQDPQKTSGENTTQNTTGTNITQNTNTQVQAPVTTAA